MIIVLVPISIAGCLFFVSKKLGIGKQKQTAVRLEGEIRESVLNCYANEGIYPPDIKYLEDNYDIDIDRTRFEVYYEVFGEDVPPQISVIEKNSGETDFNPGKNEGDAKTVLSYIISKIRTCDGAGKTEVGGFADAGDDDGVNTLHIYRDIEGQSYDERVYFYDGKIYELLAVDEGQNSPDEGTVLAKAKDLSFEMKDGLIRIKEIDVNGKENVASVAPRGLIGEGAKGDIAEEIDSGGVG